MAEKVSFGIKNVYYSKITYGENNAVTYATPVAMPGARSISLSASGDSTDWWADNVAYWAQNANSGYEGDLVLAAIPDSFRTDILGETLDAKGFYVEKSGAVQHEFALLFQFETDEKAVKHCMYRCTAARPAVASNTIENGTATPNEITLSLKVLPRIADDVVKSRAAYTTATTSSYALWFSAVQEPTAQ